MDGEGGPSWRDAAAGAALVGGALIGAVLSLAFGWYPYALQWLGCYSGLLALVSIFLLLPPRSELLLDEPPDYLPGKSAAQSIVFAAAIVVRRLGETLVTERMTFRSKGLREGEKREILAVLRTVRNSNGKGLPRKAAVPNPSQRYKRFSWISVVPGTIPSGPRDEDRGGSIVQSLRP